MVVNDIVFQKDIRWLCASTASQIVGLADEVERAAAFESEVRFLEIAQVSMLLSSSQTTSVTSRCINAFGLPQSLLGHPGSASPIRVGNLGPTYGISGPSIFSVSSSFLSLPMIELGTIGDYVATHSDWLNSDLLTANVYNNIIFSFEIKQSSSPRHPSEQDEEYETIFHELRMKWREERGISSATTQIVMCESYQRIIGMGPAALPLILTQLKSEGDKPDQWFWALRMIARTNPVPREFWGNRKAMAGFWLRWGETHGFAS